MKRTITIILTLILVIGVFSVPAFAQETFDKLDEELKIAVESSQADEILDVCIYVRYSSCPEPDFTENDYGKNLESVNAYISDYRSYKRSYYIEQNEKVLKHLRAIVDFEMIYVGQFGPYIDIAVKAENIATLVAQDMVTYVTMNDKTLIRDENGFLFEDKYIETVTDKSAYEYSELFYHHNADGNLDWVLVRGHSGEVGDIVVQMEIGYRVISYAWAENFRFGYGIYDVKQERFVDLFDFRDDVERYEDLREVLSILKIGRPVGDADNDNEMTILDATAIQKKLAGIRNNINPDADIYYLVNCLGTDGKEYRYSDYDGDGVVSVIDATGIQKHLAGME